MYSTFPDSQYYGRWDGLVPQTPDEVTEHIRMLECVEAGSCKFRLPLFAAWNPTTTATEREAEKATWIWGDLHCRAGHAIRIDD